MRIARALVAALAGLIALAVFAQIPPAALKYRPDLTREAQFIFGPGAPVPTLAAQIEQESGWRPGITAWDNGRGLAQSMDPTAKWASERFMDLGPADPYNPKWAMRFMVRLDDYNVRKAGGNTQCDAWGAGLKGYNSGMGFVLRAQKKSDQPGAWFGVTEFINAGQSEKNFEYSRLYPHWIISKRQPKYEVWGKAVDCK